MCTETGQGGMPGLADDADAAEHVAAYAAGLRYEALPPLVVERTKQSILDTLACILAGSAQPDVQRITRMVEAWGGEPCSTVINRGGLRLPPVAAVLANGAAIHQYDFDDTHDRAACHPSSSSLVPALAVAEELRARGRPVSGRELITAVVAGNEVTSRVSAAVKGGAHDFPWFRAPVVGLFGATIAAGKMRDANRAQLVEALGLALPMIGGTFASMAHPGSSVRAIRDGLAYRNGVLASAMAMEGLRGDRQVFDGPFGYYKAYFSGRYERAELVGGLGKRHEAGLISLKPWPSCRHVHAPLWALLELMEREGLGFDDVTRVTVLVGRVNQQRCKPVAADEAGHIDLLCNLPFALATGLLHRNLPLAVYQQRALSDEVLARALPKVAWRYEARQDGPWTFEPGRVEVLTADGRTLQHEVLRALGHPDNPMSEAQRREKFMMCAAEAARPVPRERAQDIITLVDRLEEPDSLERLMACLA